MNTETIDIIKTGRKNRHHRWMIVTSLLAVSTGGLCFISVLLGNTVYPLDVVFRVLQGEDIPGAAFAILTLRIPRMLAGLLSGFSFGIAGNVFQTMLRNPLASPNIIGITSGSSVAAVFCILIIRVSGTAASFSAVAVGLIVTALIYVLSQGGGFSGGKLILIGIGIQAMLNAAISFILLKAASNDVPAAMRWLSGSLNAIQHKNLRPLTVIVLILCPLIFLMGKRLNILELGEQSAITLGVPVNRTRVALILSAVCLLAFATAVTGPIAFIAFLAGPIAKRLVGIGFPCELPAGLTGAVLVLSADLLGQFAFSIKFPVGVITGIIGAPYLIFLLIRTNKAGDT